MPPHASGPPYEIDSAVRIGHVHLKVADLARALEFYSGILGFAVMQRIGDSAVFLSAGGYHHHIALNTWESFGGSPPPVGATGLYHTAILYPTRASLAATVRRVLAARIALEGVADHGVSESIYSAIRTITEWNCTATSPGNSGRATRKAIWPCTRACSL